LLFADDQKSGDLLPKMTDEQTAFGTQTAG